MNFSSILLIAKSGQLGWELNRSLMGMGEVTAVGTPEFNLETPESLINLIREMRPGCIINAAAYTAVDLAESEQERARAVNAIAPGILAEEAKRLNALLVHYSTDYVFDGEKGAPYTEEDHPHPLGVYGQTKLEGEQAIRSMGGDHLIFRTSWVYSLRQKGGFVNKVLQWSRQQKQLRLVTDQVGNPTWARLLAEVTSQLLARGQASLRERSGLYHLAGGGIACRFEWAEKILALDPNKEDQVAVELIPALTSEFPTPATRPLFSALDCTKFEQTFEIALPDWRTVLRLAMG